MRIPKDKEILSHPCREMRAVAECFRSPRPEEMGAAFGRVEYLEDCKEVSLAATLLKPSYRAPSRGALQRGQRYEWSVRLRDGDTVSTWSTTSHTAIAPVLFPGMVFVGGGSSFGQCFGFEILK
jgi:hypothetical protein